MFHHTFKAISSALCATAMWAGAVAAQAAYPDKPITLTIPFPAGGGVDVVGRLYTQQINEATGATFVIDNKGGAGGIIGVGAAVHAKADGYSFVMGSPGNVSIAPSAYSNLSYQPAKDLKPVAMGVQLPLLLVAKPNAPFNSVAELIRYGKEHPGKLTYGSGGTGTSQHLSGAMFAQKAGIDAVHVPYKGSTPALTDLIGGQVDVAFLDTSVIPNVKAGKIKLLAVTSGTRSNLLPETPTIAESGLPGYEALNWYGFFAPTGTPAEAIRWLHQKLRAAQSDPALIQRLRGQMMDVPPAMDSTAFGKFVADDTAKWSQLIKSMHLKLD